jgi:hypothetical protein
VGAGQEGSRPVASAECSRRFSESDHRHSHTRNAHTRSSYHGRHRDGGSLVVRQSDAHRAGRARGYTLGKPRRRALQAWHRSSSSAGNSPRPDIFLRPRRRRCHVRTRSPDVMTRRPILPSLTPVGARWAAGIRRRPRPPGGEGGGGRGDAHMNIRPTPQTNQPKRARGYNPSSARVVGLAFRAAVAIRRGVPSVSRTERI